MVGRETGNIHIFFLGLTAKLICVFVFAYAKCWFSHDAAHVQMDPF